MINNFLKTTKITVSLLYQKLQRQKFRWVTYHREAFRWYLELKDSPRLLAWTHHNVSDNLYGHVYSQHLWVWGRRITSYRLTWAIEEKHKTGKEWDLWEKNKRRVAGICQDWRFKDVTPSVVYTLLLDSCWKLMLKRWDN